MKKAFVIITFIVLGIWTTSAAWSDSLFCMVEKDNVIISLKQSTWYYTCNDTIASIDQLILQTVGDLDKIQYYVDKRRNISYWLEIRNQKIEYQQKLQNAKAQIMESMKTFESNLIKKYVQYFVIRITPYKISLQKSLVKIDNLVTRGYGTIDLRSYALLLKAQVTVIDSLSNAATVKELTDLLKKYVYFKKEISWKYE